MEYPHYNRKHHGDFDIISRKQLSCPLTISEKSIRLLCEIGVQKRLK